jgi:hypothetical protein
MTLMTQINADNLILNRCDITPGINTALYIEKIRQIW